MKRATHAGFTLLELLVVVAIIGILMSIAIPSYQDYIRKARRGDGKTTLLTTAQAMERFYTENSTYSAATLGTTSTAVGKTTTAEGYYTIGFDSAPTSATICGSTTTTSPSASAFRICATPTGAQANDSCSILSLSHTGEKYPTSGGCW